MLIDFRGEYRLFYILVAVLSIIGVITSSPPISKDPDFKCFQVQIWCACVTFLLIIWYFITKHKIVNYHMVGFLGFVYLPLMMVFTYSPIETLLYSIALFATYGSLIGDQKFNYLIMAIINLIVLSVTFFSRTNCLFGLSRAIIQTCIYLGVSVSLLITLYNLQKGLQEQNERNKLFARLDPLTNIYNRRYFDEFLKENLTNVFTIAVIDIDNFKSLNDTKGHLFGDSILQKFTEFAKQFFPKKMILFRYGGDEFVIISPFNDVKTNQILKSFQKQLYVHWFYLTTISIGISKYGPLSIDKLKEADTKMYEDKRKHKESGSESHTNL